MPLNANLGDCYKCGEPIVYSVKQELHGGAPYLDGHLGLMVEDDDLRHYCQPCYRAKYIDPRIAELREQTGVSEGEPFPLTDSQISEILDRRPWKEDDYDAILAEMHIDTNKANYDEVVKQAGTELLAARLRLLELLAESCGSCGRHGQGRVCFDCYNA